MNNLKIFGKFLDQPILISKLNKSMPAIMGIGGTLLFANNAIDTFKKSQDKEQTKKELLKKGIVMATAIASALIAPKLATKITKREPIETFENLSFYNLKGYKEQKRVLYENTKAFLEGNKVIRPEIERIGYTLDGWFCNGEEWRFPHSNFSQS